MSSPQQAPTPAAWAFAEDFLPQSEAAEAARAAAAELGITPVGRGTASLLTFLAKTVQARAVVEVGSGSGVSGLALFAGMEPQGILTSVDSEHEHQTAARKAFMGVGIANRRFRLIAGAALDVLPKLTDAAYDIVFIDGDKLEYVEYVAQAMRLLRPGGLLVLNHALWASKVADTNNSEDETIVIREALAAVQENEELTAVLTPVGDGLLVAVRA